jgi:Uma2 family endonuclease
MTTTLARPRRRLHREGVLFPGISWKNYERIGRIFWNRPIRITYDRGQMEIMTTSNEHERIKHLVRRLLDVLVEELNIEICGAGSMTFKRQTLKKGLEPDECYWIQHESIVRGRMDYDIQRDPPPDLVLEVEISRSVLNRLGIYAALGVPEIWRFNRKILKVCRLVNGAYQVVDRSLAFPFLNPAALLAFLNRQPPYGEIALSKAFREWVRQQQASGWPNGGV